MMVLNQTKEYFSNIEQETEEGWCCIKRTYNEHPLYYCYEYN